MKIGVYTNHEKDRDNAVSNALKRAAADYNFECVDLDLDKVADCDFAAVIGGDGTMLSIAKQCALNSVPVIGINKGYLGFLTEILPSEISDCFEKLSKNDFTIEKRHLMKISVGDKEFYALNEALVKRKIDNKICQVEISIDNSQAGVVKGDGVIVSTPTGSTAYSLSCGGPVISPDLNLLLIVAVCPHSLHNIPIVTGDRSVVELKSNTALQLVIDGNCVADVEANQTVEMKVSDVCAQFVRFSKQNFYSRLLNKMLNW